MASNGEQCKNDVNLARKPIFGQNLTAAGGNDPLGSTRPHPFYMSGLLWLSLTWESPLEPVAFSTTLCISSQIPAGPRTRMATIVRISS